MTKESSFQFRVVIRVIRLEAVKWPAAGKKIRRRSTKIEGEVSLQLLRYDISLYSVEISSLIIA